MTTGPSPNVSAPTFASVTFKHSNLTVPWDDKYASLLELAEAHGLKPDFSCRSGICSTCISELLSGEISYFTEPLDPPEDGMALICCSRPVSDVILNI